ncbi:MAG: alpha/beta hydrolase family protein [Candidatus Binatia bacterium]
MTEPLHPDVVVGRLSDLLEPFASPVANTLADLGVYGGRPLAQLFPAPRTRPAVTTTTRWRLPGLVSEDLVFRSAHVPLERRFRRRYRDEYPETHLVYARRIRPTSARARPRLLYLHGYMQPETLVEEMALLSGMALRLNVEVIQMQPPYHGRRAPRASRFSGELYWTADLVRSIEALRQSLLDARTLLHWLLAEDPRPVGVAGLSLGGALAACLACVEERFAFAIPLIAHMDLAALVADAPVLARMRRQLRSFGWGDREPGASSPARLRACRPRCPARVSCSSPPPRTASSRPASSGACGSAGAGRRCAGTPRATWASSSTSPARCG